jgi:NAD dependent epimerase/dehydratase family enzyme
VLLTDTLHGPVNITAPQPVTNRQLATTLGRVLGRPTLLPVPARVVRMALGEMADEVLLAGARVQPQRLQETQYTFRHPELEGALRYLLGRA